MEGSTATTVEELIAENEAYKKSLKYKIKHLFEDEAVEPAIKNAVEIELETEKVE